MKSQVLKTTNRIVPLVLFFSLLISFQNCSVYESDGRKAFESTIATSDNKGCYPYIDTNLAMDYLGITDEANLNVFKTTVSDEDAVNCDFYGANTILNHINCKVSQGNAEQAFLLEENGTTAFDGILSTWTVSPSSGFSGTHFIGYISQNTDLDYVVRFLALDGDDTKGVGCSVILTPGDYLVSANLVKVKSALSKITFAMSINNQE